MRVFLPDSAVVGPAVVLERALEESVLNLTASPSLSSSNAVAIQIAKVESLIFDGITIAVVVVIVVGIIVDC